MSELYDVAVTLREPDASGKRANPSFSVKLDFRPFRGEIINLANEKVDVDGTPTLFSKYLNDCGLEAGDSVRVLEVVHYAHGSGGNTPYLAVVAERCVDPSINP
jgi:hypothetical protein